MIVVILMGKNIFTLKILKSSTLRQFKKYKVKYPRNTRAPLFIFRALVAAGLMKFTKIPMPSSLASLLDFVYQSKISGGIGAKFTPIVCLTKSQI